MKRINPLSALNHYNLAIYKQRVAYHKAGHAAAIHLNNRLKNLPTVPFKITLDSLESHALNNRLSGQSDTHSNIAKIKGERLIQSLPFALNGTDPEYSDAIVFRFVDGYHPVFEADIVNLLAGPLAEAKQVALMDDEPFHSQLLTVQSLQYYGGDADLKVANDYLQHYSADKQVQEESLQHFLRLAFDFVNDKANWKSITRLANYLMTCHQHEVSSQKVAAILDHQHENLNLIRHTMPKIYERAISA